jgi:VWFA-related protein
MRQIAIILGAVLFAAGPLTAAGQQAQNAPRATATQPTTVSAILVDVVVRDRKGDPVRDLTENDFEVYEDGVKQDVGSMTPIFLPDPASAAGAATAGKPDTAAAPAAVAKPVTPPPDQSAVAAQEAVAKAPQIIALVFDRLTADSRTLAYRAAMKYLGDQETSNNYMAVYGIDIKLIPLQNFTRNAALIRKAIDKFSTLSTSQFGSTTEDLKKADANQMSAMDLQDRANQAAATGGAAGGAAAAAIGADAAQAQFQQMSASMTQTFDSLERDQAGFASTDALLSVVNGMRSIPGRKSIVFFSEGMALPPNVFEQFRSVIDAANRANISIYPMDAMGLRAESTVAQVRDEINNEGKLNTRRTGRDQAGGAMMANLERNEDLLRMDPSSGLGELADKTGGFLIQNTNDLRGGFTRIESDMRNYYMLTYVPKNDNFDGRFRDINVKVKRSGVSVHSRKGYYAVRETPGVPVRSYEAPALAALDRTPVPNAFPVRASFLRFPEKDHPQMLSVVVELSTAPITFQPSEDKKTYTSDFTVLVRFSDANKQVVDKVSQRYQVAGPIEKLDQAKNGQVVFYRQPELPQGFYTMETVVYDAFSKKSSVRFTTIEQPNQDIAQLRMSSLVLVSRGEKAEATADTDNPLIVHNTLLYPNLGVPFKKASDKELAFFFTAYAGADAKEPLSGTIELLQNANVLARSSLQLAAADPDGRVQQLSRIPIEALQPGDYQLRVLVTQGSRTVARSTEFRIES